MPGIIQTALANAVLVTAAAPLVWAVARLARRPALTHALWLIVLFKLLTPPLWVFPVQLPQSQPKAVAPVATSVQPVLTMIVPSDPPGVVVSSPYAVEPSAGETPRFIFVAPQPVVGTPSVAALSPVAPSRPFDWRPLLVPAIEIIWALGAGICLLVAAVRVIRFSRALRWAGPSPAAAQARVDALARLLRLGPAPRVQFIPGNLCPMLWPIGRWPRLLIPRALWDRLDPIQRDTVLLHELAHWARRDHWVRWIELLATSLYWWLPACWWARRDLRRAEEQCCDAWVLWAMPGTFHNYANALLEAVEFVSVRADRPSASIAVPALASGMGQFSDLKGRLTMLKHGNVSRALSWGGMAAVFGLGALLLPASPTIGQDEPAPGVSQPAPADDPPRVDTPDVAPPPGTPAPPKPLNVRATPAARPGTADRSIDKMLAAMKILPDDECSDSVYIRRAYLNLLGIHPDPDAVRAFEEDAGPRLEKRQLLLQKLLAREEAPAGPYARQLLESQRRIDELTRQLQEADARIAALKAEQDRAAAMADASRARSGVGSVAGSPANALPPGGQSTVPAPSGAVPMDPNQGQPFGLRAPRTEPRAETAPPPGMGGATPPPTGPRVVIIHPPNGTVREVGPDGVAREFPQAYRLERALGEKESERLDKVEAELQALLQEIHAIRAQSGAALRWSAPATPPPPTLAPPVAPGILPPPVDPTPPPAPTPGDQPATR